MRDLRDLPEVISTTTITVYGAGAIGGVTGAALAEAGHDVLLVDRAVDHVTAMNAHGLTVDRRTGSSTTRVRAITPDVLGSGLELLLLAVKSQDTPAALEVLAPRLATDGAIVSLQNGLNEELIAAAVGARRTVGCLVNWAATGRGRAASCTAARALSSSASSTAEPVPACSRWPSSSTWSRRRASPTTSSATRGPSTCTARCSWPRPSSTLTSTRSSSVHTTCRPCWSVS